MSEQLIFHIGMENKEIQISDWVALRRWLETERTRWNWLIRGSATDVAQTASNVQSRWDDVFQHLINREGIEKDVRTASVFMNRFSGREQLISSESVDGQTVLDIRKSSGDVAAAAAYGFIMGWLTLQNVNSPEILRGVVLTANPNFTNASEIENRLNLERKNTRNMLRAQSDSLALEFQNQSLAFDKMVKRGKSLGLRVLRYRRDYFNKMTAEWREDAERSIKNINSVRKQYQEFMGLRAPVDYWSIKSVDHEKSINNSRNYVTIFFVVFTLMISLAFYGAGSFIVNHQQVIVDKKLMPTPVALYVLISAGLAILSTVGFWVGRLLTRLYLSHHHLKTDADERAVMIKTYLALLESGAASAEERTIILSAIFRPSSDGIVKDDGPPDINIQAMASKFLTGSR